MSLSRASRNSIRTLLAAIPAACSADVGNDPWIGDGRESLETVSGRVFDARVLGPWDSRDKVLEAIRAALDEHPRISTAVHYIRLADVVDERDPWIAAAREIPHSQPPQTVSS